MPAQPSPSLTESRQRLHFDGSFETAQPHGDLWYEAPFAADPKPYVLKQLYWQQRERYRPLDLDSTTTGVLGNYFHAGESDFEDLGAGIVQFLRTYAALPVTRTEGTSRVHTYQIVVDDLAEITLGVNCRVQYDYFHTLDPTTIPIHRATRLVKLGSEIIYRIGPSPATKIGGYIVAEDSSYRQWLGNIYERATPLVPERSLVTNS